MAYGRMIVKEFSWDSRIWEELSELAALLFAGAIPHIESDGPLPADPRMLRLVICPASKKYSDADVAAAVAAWRGTHPPLVTDAPNKKLLFVDFERANWNLEHLRQRRSRQSRMSQMSQVSQKSPRREEKRREEKSTKSVGAFRPPTSQDVQAYCLERKNVIDPSRFVDYYTANGWRVGRTPMRDWRAAVRTWERNEGGGGYGQKRVVGAASPVKDKYGTGETIDTGS